MVSKDKQALIEKKQKQQEELKKINKQLKAIEAKEKKQAQEEANKAYMLIGSAIYAAAKTNPEVKNHILSAIDKELSDRNVRFVKDQFQALGLES